jgi:hypothetical protein
LVCLKPKSRPKVRHRQTRPNSEDRYIHRRRQQGSFSGFGSGCTGRTLENGGHFLPLDPPGAVIEPDKLLARLQMRSMLGRGIGVKPGALTP